MEGCMTERTTRYREPAVLSLGIWSILHHLIKILSMYWTRVYGKTTRYIRPITRVSGNQKMFHYIWSREVPFSCDFNWMNGKTFQVSNIWHAIVAYGDWGCITSYSISQEVCTLFCCALLCCGYAIVHNEFTWIIYPYSSGLLCWHWGNC